ncbi:DUF771 domain-containing protein [Paenibacillus sp. 2TAB19]|uniref:DUF771 domain-containing protein n=1 Tax=Paenibacillus sp. 2TAB19 TaxID=3233003 RepID=UPI003F9E7755
MEQQQISVQLTIPIPSDSVLISKIELEGLKKDQLAGVYWTMSDLVKRTSRSVEWIKENILYPSRFRSLLDVQHGGFVYYPESRGQQWCFHAPQMAAFLDKRFNQIFNQIA